MSTEVTPIHTLIIGAGQAGLATSHHLLQRGIPHVVLERDRVGASWRTRWDSFMLNTPNQISTLPGMAPVGPEDGFLGRDEWVARMEAYTSRNELPVRTGVTVRSVESRDGGYAVHTDHGVWQASNLVLCTGDQNRPRIPALATEIPDDVVQLHSSRYRSPAGLPDGAVLVVGSGQTGVQIAEDLLDAGRSVWLCSSRVGRAPRRYRGRDITGWVEAIGMANQTRADVPAEELSKPQGMISGTRGGHSVSLHALGHQGASLLGRLERVDGRVLRIGADLLENVAVGDQAVAQLRAGLDGYIQKAGLDAPPAAEDPADRPFDGLEAMAAVRSVDLDEAGIASVIWATGFGGDFSYLPEHCVDGDGLPKHTAGICEASGLYCVGLKWGRRRISALITGADEDAAHVVAHLATRSS